MTKDQLITQISKDAAITKAAATKALSSFTSCVQKTLKKNGRVGLLGFGTFSVRKRNARIGRNPRTGEALKIKAKKVVKFSPGKILKESI